MQQREMFEGKETQGPPRKIVKRDPSDDEEEEIDYRKRPQHSEDQEIDLEAPVSKMEPEDLKDLIKSFEKDLKTNQKLRIVHSKDPSKYMDSEVELASDIMKFNALTTDYELWPLFLESNVLESLLTLINHDNVDLSIEVINLIKDLVDVEVTEDNSKYIVEFIKQLIDKKMIEALVLNLERFDDSKREEFEGIFNTMNIFENLLEVKPDLAKEVCDKTPIMQWLVDRAADLNKPFDDNKLYASEILAILVQNSRENQFTLGKKGGIEKLLQLQNKYRKEDPKFEEESELLENCFDCLLSALLVKENQELFRRAEGFELMLGIIKTKKPAAVPALKVLNYALNKSPKSCKHFIEAGGLKLVFPILMGKGIKDKKKENTEKNQENCLCIIQALLSTSEGVELDRITFKFKENEGEKIKIVADIFTHHKKRLQEYEVKNAESEDDPQLQILRKLDNGLFHMQQCTYILSKLVTSPNEELAKMTLTILDGEKIEKGDLIDVLDEWETTTEDLPEFQETKKDLQDLLASVKKV